MKNLVLALVALFVLGAGVTAAVAGGKRGSASAQAGSVAEVVVVASDLDRVGKQTTAWETVRSVDVTVPAGESARLLVRFTSPVAECLDAFSRSCYFRVLVGSQTAVPKEFRRGGLGAPAFQLEAVASVGPGKHTVNVQWRKPAAPAVLRFRGYIMVVERIRG
jgi:hypothetical protein